MKRFLSAASLLSAGCLLLAFTGPASAFPAPETGAKKCSECHNLSKEEAGKLLMADKFKAKISDVREAPVKGVWEVELTQGDKTIIVYVDYSKKYLVEAKFTELGKLAEAAEPPKAKVVDLKKIPLDKAVVLGNAKAEKRVIIFDDPDCPYCRQLDKEVKKILETRKDIAFYVKMLPLPIHPNAYAKSKAIVCNKSAADLLADAMADRELPKSTCDTKELDNNIKLAEELGIHGTPGIILPDGRLIPGYVQAETLLNLIDTPPDKQK
ncbi:MAG: DsbC family protein [Deltaproteobacteria bacterium]|nr:DsbC family protein [Deltaproteobacteria bacterium]